jgi:hypothetical protein
MLNPSDGLSEKNAEVSGYSENGKNNSIMENWRNQSNHKLVTKKRYSKASLF